LKSLGIVNSDNVEVIIDKILKGMKPGDYATGDMFSFINSEVGKYVSTVTKIEGNNFKISTKGFATGLMLKDQSTITISKDAITTLNIPSAYKVTLNGLTNMGKKQIYQNIWINDNSRYMYENKKWFKANIK
jgi:hypothetical protein